ncbi:MAG: hypothetical protein KIT31_03960 [Deltaproteobacteria bacterium]|nr:hypothetical protein [Deltaproteobacteria bacterium]
MEQFRIFRALGLSFRSWFRNFIPFTLMAALLYAPVIIWIAVYDPTGAGGLEAAVNNTFVRPVFAMVGIAALLPPLLIYRVVQELNGQKVSMLASVKYGLRGILPAVILAVVVNAVSFIPMGGIVGAILTCIWFVAAPAAVAERLGPFAAFGRSSYLTQGRRWGIFGLTFLLGLVMMVLLFAWIAPMINSNPFRILSNLKPYALAFVVILGLFHMFTGIVQAVSYCLLRKDKDGVSHEELARVFE